MSLLQMKLEPYLKDKKTYPSFPFKKPKDCAHMQLGVQTSSKISLMELLLIIQSCQMI